MSVDFSLDELNLTDESQTSTAASGNARSVFNPFEILGVSLNASSLEIREAYLRLKSTFQSSNDSMYSLMSEEESRAALNDMDRAYDELRDIDSRGKYLRMFDPDSKESATRYADERDAAMARKENEKNLSRFPSVGDTGHPTEGGVSSRRIIGNLKVRADKVEDKGLQEKLKAILADSEIGAGATVLSLREAAGLDRKAVEFNTKVSEHIIESIETDDFANLPAPVYVRGFLKNFFKFVALGEQKEFIDSYTERLNGGR